MEELMNNNTQVTEVAETVIEKAPTFFEKHGSDVAKVGIGALIGGAVTIGVQKGVRFIKKKIEARKARKAAAVAEVTEELPEETTQD